MGSFNLDDYEPVDQRIKKYIKNNPDARITTKLIHDDGSRVVFQAFVFKSVEELAGNTPQATGHAEEVKGDGYVNKTSHLENCETSAIGRALANAGYSGDKRPSREEMSKVNRNTTPDDGMPQVDDLAGKCNKCGSVLVPGQHGSLYCKQCFFKRKNS